jgi:hypothetical protein
MQDSIKPREQENFFGTGGRAVFQRKMGLVMLETARKIPAHLDAEGPKNLPS